MALMQWNRLFNTNVKIIDEQHQGLVEILNSLYDSMQKDDSSEKLGQTLEKLVNYTIVHFETEEKLSDEYEYPEGDKHKDEHNKLTQQVTELLENYKSGKVVVSDDVMLFLKEWLKNHIIHTDKRLGTFLNSRGVY